MKNFHYRYVPFGTNFERAKGMREQSPDLPEQGPSANLLFENEIACDVGGACLSSEGDSLCVLDHHFDRPHQFPSASAAVLHQLPLLAEQFRLPDDGTPVWLVSHQAPDFDALASLYLVRQWLQGKLSVDMLRHVGLSPKDARTLKGGQIDWCDLPDELLPERERGLWAFLLAAYASRVDNAIKLDVPRNRSLHGVLYAALYRGRNYAANGACPLFDFITERLCDPELELNPLCDDIFRSADQFSPELDLLERQEAAYASDIRRARRSKVYLPAGQFQEWFPKVDNESLHIQPAEESSDEEQINPKHFDFDDDNGRTFDGLYLRDPECLFFKEYARQDVENSPLGRGFTFTAIAYSSKKEDNSINGSEYYFSLDPETSGHAHLYPVWATLQAKEDGLASRGTLESEMDRIRSDKKEGKARSGFEKRTKAPDPWFDGHNYQCKIVVTPGFGTLLHEGIQPDLSDDEVVNLVKSVLETRFFASLYFSITDFSLNSSEAKNAIESSCTLSEILDHSHPENSLRFAQIPIRKELDLFSKSLSIQIGEYIWKALEEPGIATVPRDFVDRHLVFDKHVVAVWNRNGIAIAYRSGDPMAEKFCQHVKATLERVTAITTALKRELQCPEGDSDLGTRDLLRSLTEIRLRSTSEEGRVLRRFLHAMDFDNLLDSVHALNREEAEEREARHERLLTYLAALFIFPSLLLAFFDAVSDLRPIDFPLFWQQLREKGWLATDWTAWPSVSILTALSLLAALFCLQVIGKRQK